VGVEGGSGVEEEEEAEEESEEEEEEAEEESEEEEELMVMESSGIEEAGRILGTTLDCSAGGEEDMVRVALLGRKSTQTRSVDYTERRAQSSQEILRALRNSER
jgi:hypothetical protein